ncbi:SDR family NAD(P)-dependent oxidoreductase [Nocardioides immobilis]|uniref:SDR family NAD(P)-dependent oxidoreductase n=2 Tax=Nocardioides immobilis TaxID=2049295 RepID=A0A417XXH3_9ACTN|nr:SDR family NAD(P)-dependent oxidoreductase [Nocardioides immobilis]
MHRYSVNDKVALVTGAARGIGFATAQDLYERGASVVLVDLDAEATVLAAKQLGDRAIGIGADVTDPTAMEEAVARTVETFGRLDIVMANAGIAPELATVRVMEPALFEKVLDVNVLGVYRTVHAALPQIIENQGQVVVVASVYAFVNGVMVAPYAMSKSAVEQLGRALRGELALHGASASVAYFGFVDTAMVREGFGSSIAQRFEATFPSFLRRRLTPAQAGKAVVDGIESRAPRIITPQRWSAYSVLRGVINPLLDRRIERNAKIQRIVKDADVAVAEVRPIRPA